jgi:hypothetical protein
MIDDVETDREYVQAIIEIVDKIEVFFEGHSNDKVAGACMWVLAAMSSRHSDRYAKVAHIPEAIARFWPLIDKARAESAEPPRTLQ